jgi:hypothetical protein
MEDEDDKRERSDSDAEEVFEAEDDELEDSALRWFSGLDEPSVKTTTIFVAFAPRS